MQTMYDEVALASSEFYAVSGDSEIQVRHLISRFASVFIMRPSLLVGTFCTCNDTDAFAVFMNAVSYDRGPTHMFFRTLTPSQQRIVWSFSAIVSHAVRECRKDPEIPKTWPLCMRVVAWLETHCSGNWRTTLPAVLLVQELIEAIKCKN